MRKVCVVVANRANYGRVKSLLTAVKGHEQLRLQLVLTASALVAEAGNAEQTILADGFTADAVVPMLEPGDRAADMVVSTGRGLIGLADVFTRLDPDIVVTVADRYETMATAVAAAYMNLPLAHIQGGEVSGSIDESVRHAVTKLSHIHFPATRLAGETLIRMGEDPNKVFVTGCPSLDLLASMDMDLGRVDVSLDMSKPFVLVLQHPVTLEASDSAGQIQQTIAAVSALSLPVLWLAPNVDAGSAAIRDALMSWASGAENRVLHGGFGPEDYLRLINAAACVIGNSSSFLREGAFLGVPAVNVGNRQRLREHGANVTHAPHDRDAILAAAKAQIAHGRYTPDYRFGGGTAGVQMADLLAEVDLSLLKTLFPGGDRT